MKKKTVRKKSPKVLRTLTKARAAKAKKRKTRAAAFDCDSLAPLDRARCLARRQGLGFPDIRKLVGDTPGLEQAATVGAAEGRTDYLLSLHHARRRGSLSALKLCFEKFCAPGLAMVDTQFAARYLARVTELIKRHAPEYAMKPAPVAPVSPTPAEGRTPAPVPAEAAELARLGATVEDIRVITGHDLNPDDIELHYIDLRREVAQQVIADCPKGQYTTLLTYAKNYLRTGDPEPAASAPGRRAQVDGVIAKIYDEGHTHVRRTLEGFRGLEPGSLERRAK